MFRHALPSSARSSIRRQWLSTIRVDRLAQHTRTSPAQQSRSSATLTPESAALSHTKRYVKLTLVGLLAAVVTAGSVWEGIHLYTEHVAMAPEADPEVKQWEWDIIDDAWTGDPTLGGTDPALGFWARHAVRAAWMSYNWASPEISVATRAAGSETDQEGIHASDYRLASVEYNLRNAIAEAERSTVKLHPYTLATLLLRHAGTLEEFGPLALSSSQEEYERAWRLFSDPIHRAFIAWRLGNVDSRLGHDSGALEWWKKSLQLVQGHDLGNPSRGLTVPKSPLAQRILFSSLVSQSAHLAQSGKLKEAQLLEESALDSLRSIQPPESIASASPPEALHALYLLQRSSLLSVHLAEVLHAQHCPVFSSVQYLTSAAESSERVTHALIGSPLHQKPDSDKERTSTPSKNTDQLLPVYASSRSMNTAATELLRDARRTAAEAWNLLGILYENKEGTTSRTAFSCFKHAIKWAGAVKSNGNDTHVVAADDILESDFRIYWSNYQRTKNALEKI